MEDNTILNSDGERDETQTSPEVLTVEKPEHYRSSSPHMNTPTKKKKSSTAMVVILILALLAVPLLCSGIAIYSVIGMRASDIPQRIEQAITENTNKAKGQQNRSFDFDDVADSQDDESLSVKVAAAALPSVVSISVGVETGADPYGPPTQQQVGSGSGVVIDSDGYILTNNHVIATGSLYSVNTGSETLEAKLVGTDPTTDIAVLKVDSTKLKAIKVGTSKNLQLGQYVMALGSPFGLENSVSTGIISGLGRNSTIQGTQARVSFVDLIQTDAAINPGNSGGALVNARAELIGINTLIQSTSGSSAGVGFAIPIDSAILIARQLIETGRADHPFLGVASQTINSDIANMYSLPRDSGAYVVSVVEASPAEKAGLKIGDIIINVDGEDISTSEDVFSAVRSKKVGDSITITYYRNGEKQEVDATLASTDAVPTQQNYHQSQ